MPIIPQLLQHGTHFNSGFEPIPGLPNLRTDDANLQVGQEGILRQYNKRQRASATPLAMGWIKATYSEAIEYTSEIQSLKGSGFAFTILGALILLPFCVLMVLTPFILAMDASRFAKLPWYAILSTCVVMPLAGSAISWSIIRAIISTWRMEFFQLADQPIIFDRKHRRVYRIFSEMPLGNEPWPIYACAYEWDLINAEHHKERTATTGAISSNHYLVFIVRKSAIDTSIIGTFQVGDALSLTEELTDAMWEHIRRFMEENGPHLPSPDEPLAVQKAPLSWWQSLGVTGIFGPGYFRRWKTQREYMLLGHLIFPVSIPYDLLRATGNWYSYKTQIEVDWPDEVKEAVGF